MLVSVGKSASKRRLSYSRKLNSAQTCSNREGHLLQLTVLLLTVSNVDEVMV